MPFTPYHFGPGLLIKGIAARWFSWFAFVAAQVVIDCETLYYLVRNEYPVHRRLHTFVGGTIAGAATAATIIGARWLAQHARPQFSSAFRGLSPSMRAEVTTMGLLAGGLVGGASHPFLDGLLYTDIQPLYPFAETNPFLGMIRIAQLQTLCEVVGVAGFLLVAMWLYAERRAA
jgi:hypothetical protein